MRVILFLTLLSITSCGWIKREASKLTGKPSEYCYKGVEYLQFPSGSTVAVNRDGTPIRCN